LIRAILDAPLQTEEGANLGNELEEALDVYKKTVFPFWEADKKRELAEAKEVLKSWTGSVSHITIDVLPDPVSELKFQQRVARANRSYALYNEQISNMVRTRLE
jgi:hypothetical protein